MPERPDLYPPSCVHPEACECSIVETTKIVPTEIPVFVVKHGKEKAELPTGAQALGWLSDRHAEEQRAQRKTVDAGEAAPDVTVSDA